MVLQAVNFTGYRLKRRTVRKFNKKIPLLMNILLVSFFIYQYCNLTLGFLIYVYMKRVIIFQLIVTRRRSYFNVAGAIEMINYYYSIECLVGHFGFAQRTWASFKFQPIMKDTVRIGHLTKFGAIRLDRDQVIDL